MTNRSQRDWVRHPAIDVCLVGMFALLGTILLLAQTTENHWHPCHVCLELERFLW